ncbi:glycosyltransferase family 2 protein [Candidatus Pelagibacter sp.]|uniref:glycosyltransferase family 2 protein n=1 Tax=Candidatus Pelagibacter sp. TaxID=2024849 RepID=UPI003F85A5F5
MKNLTLIIPTKKESESLPVFLDEMKKFNCKKLIVLERDDRETIEIIKKDENIELLFQNQKGYGSAIIEGINYSKTEYSCIINADGSMDPNYLKEMLEECRDKDFVFNSRYLYPGGGSEDDTVVTLIGNKIFSFLGNLFFKLNISDILFTYIIGKTKSFQKLNLMYRDFRLCVEIPIKAKRNKLLYKSIPSYERSRIAGKKKVNAIKDGFLILFGMVSLFFRK